MWVTEETTIAAPVCARATVRAASAEVAAAAALKKGVLLVRRSYTYPAMVTHPDAPGRPIIWDSEADTRTRGGFPPTGRQQL